MHKSETVMVKASQSAVIADTVLVKGNGIIVVGDYVTIEDYVLLDTGTSANSIITIGARTKIKHGAVLRTYDGEISIGERSSIGEYSILSGHGGLRIGSAVIIAGQCYFSAADHIFNGQAAVRFQGETAKGIAVEDGAWFGARCIILDGVVVGMGCVVGAGSVITKSLHRDMLCFGSPCKEIRLRVELDLKDC